jgi:branched-chain amino acid aminotransferase
VFVVLDGEVVTPPLSSGCLPGVTRGLVIEWCGAYERDIEFTMFNQINELFLTSTTRGIHPVTILDDRNLVVGDVTRRLQSEFQQLSRMNVNP